MGDLFLLYWKEKKKKEIVSAKPNKKIYGRIYKSSIEPLMTFANIVRQSGI